MIVDIATIEAEGDMATYDKPEKTPGKRIFGPNIVREALQDDKIRESIRESLVKDGRLPTFSHARAAAIVQAHIEEEERNAAGAGRPSA